MQATVKAVATLALVLLSGCALELSEKISDEQMTIQMRAERAQAMVRAYNQVDRWSLRHAAYVVTTNEPFAAALASLAPLAIGLFGASTGAAAALRAAAAHPAEVAPFACGV